MTDLPLVSIVTPSFNQGQFLEQTIHSVLGQEYPRLEYILVDGGSTDGSLEIIRRHAERLTWWVSEPDSGQAEAINKGFAHAHGEIVAWLNSDDIHLPGAILQAAAAFQAHPQVGLVFGDCLAIDEHGSVLNRMRYGDWGLKELMEFHIIGQPAVFFRRSVLEAAGGLDPSYQYLLDHHLWLRMAQLTEVSHLPQVLAAGRFHSQAKNTTHSIDFPQEVRRIAEWMQSQPALSETLLQDHRRIQAGIQRLSAFYQADGGQPAAALRSYWKSFWLSPSIALQDWRHILLAFSEWLGIKNLRAAYRRLRQRRHRNG